MPTRRKFIRNVAGASAALIISFKEDTMARIVNTVRNHAHSNSTELASEEEFWIQIQNAFDVERNFIHLNSGGVSAAPKAVINSLKNKIEYANRAPSYYMWRHQEPEIEKVREKIASAFGCDKEEIAITRNASESLQNIQKGLDFVPGDELLTTTQDYPRMINTFNQLERRMKVKIVKVEYPVPLYNPQDYVESLLRGITGKTKIILISHICFLTGQILPVREVCNIAHQKGIEVICDGAHSFNHIPFRHTDLDCDYFGASLHKWTYAPVGTGMLFVRKNLIKKVWPLMAAQESLDENIRKFEEIGTHPAANHNAILDALIFNENIGIERKLERLRYLNLRWISRVNKYENVRFNLDISNKNNFGGIICFGIKGVDPSALCNYLFESHKIYTIPIVHEQFNGIRVTPNLFTTLEEIDKFALVIERIASRELTVK